MVDNTNKAGGQAVKRAAVERAQAAASQTDDLGPGTAGYTTSGAAYRGMEVASQVGAPTPAERGFSNTARGGKMQDDGPA